MKNSLVILALFAATSVSFATDLGQPKNGDFESGKQFWKSNGKVVVEKGGNKVIELKASERASDTLSQDVDMGKLTQVQLTFRAKGIVFKGEGIRISMEKGDGSYTYWVEEVSEGEWKQFKLTLSREGAEKKYALIFEPSTGKGSIQIDDVKIGPVESAAK